MEILVLGAHNTESQHTRCTSLLVDGVLALDAGGLTSSLSFEAQMGIRALLITHQHYDHTRDIPFLAMNFYLRNSSLDICCTQPAYDAISNRLLDGELYPDFRRTPQSRPAIRFNVLEPYRESEFSGYRILPVPVNHSVPAVGYQVTSPDGKKIFYTSDTGPGLSECWRYVSPDVLFVEVTASDRFEDFARQAKHLTPGLLRQELVSFQSSRGFLPRVVLVHINPTEEAQIAVEMESVSRSLNATISLSHEGMRVHV